MDVKVAPSAGFCFGVRRAVETVEELINSGKKVCTIGPMIHNPQYIASLERRGVTIADRAADVPADRVAVVRTHGLPKEETDYLEASGVCFTDATCPFVAKIHRIVEENSSDGTVTFIAGDPEHPEVRGIMSRAHGTVEVVGSPEELSRIASEHPEYRGKKILLVSQTTFNSEVYKKIKENLNFLFTNAIFFDTICNATSKRQNEARELSLECDAVIVIGGRNSSNTRKLFDVCSDNCRAYLIESASELKGIDLTGSSIVGITAGASTPDGIIKEVLCAMSDIINENPIINEEPAAEPAVEETVAVEEPAVEEAAPAAEPAAEEPAAQNDNEFAAAMEQYDESKQNEKYVEAIVVEIKPVEIIVDIGRKQTGYIPLEEFSRDPNVDLSKEVKVGDVIKCMIMKTNDSEGMTMLSKIRYDSVKYWDDVVEAEKNKTPLVGKIIEKVKNASGVSVGVIALSLGFRFFIPGSHCSLRKVENIDELLDSLIGTEAEFQIIELEESPRRRGGKGSIRLAAKQKRDAARKAFWEQVAVGQHYTGKVTTLMPYGAFVDLGGDDGMIPVSEISWSRIRRPSDVLKVGQEVEVVVKGIDPEKHNISLGYRKDEDNPWEILRQTYKVGDTCEGKIKGLADFGAFAEILPGIQGLIHVSQIANRRITKPSDELNVGDTVTVKITDIDFDRQRVSLSIRALLEDAEPKAENDQPRERRPRERRVENAYESKAISLDDLLANAEAQKEFAEEAGEGAVEE
ncbi:MAG: bifunctional 4-hydroxy-3-methylbut-2-enyl diphosphate reductase/30S ribosomal protein S1 [Clostridiales bacterium]|nr:bifunctional 4-hydroxy-3-methylbut-2-enyl diphosphate reductase/30S ribosomal protein S1 [Clostridiales bacterium]